MGDIVQIDKTTPLGMQFRLGSHQMLRDLIARMCDEHGTAQTSDILSAEATRLGIMLQAKDYGSKISEYVREIKGQGNE
jgi:hypothetical protein